MTRIEKTQLASTETPRRTRAAGRRMISDINARVSRLAIIFLLFVSLTDIEFIYRNISKL
jgi:hypothetical protein